MERISQMTLQEVASMQVNQRLILQGISWDFYERLLDEFKSSNALHFAYDNGTLEVEVPLLKHERPTEVLRDLITQICIEKEIDFLNAGKTTFRQPVKAKGVEPDSCFYIQNEAKLRGKMEINLAHDPPPDLVIEVDVTSPSLDKLPIYAALGVSEVWLYKGEHVEFLQLVGVKYHKVKNSTALPFLSSEKTNELLQNGLAKSSLQWFKDVREWIKSK